MARTSSDNGTDTDNATGKTQRGKTVRVECDGRTFFLRLTPLGDLIVRRRNRRRGVTFYAHELIRKHDQMESGTLFPEALVNGNL